MIKKRKNGIKAARLKAGLTQAQLALAVGVSITMISQAERGTKTITLPLANEIATVLGCRVEDFLR